MSSDDPITPIQAIQPLREGRDIDGLRRHPSLRQLQQWLAFSKKKAKDRKDRLQKSQSE
jgi:hypothetical protein